jgi:hypothetical protein
LSDTKPLEEETHLHHDDSTKPRGEPKAEPLIHAEPMLSANSLPKADSDGTYAHVVVKLVTNAEGEKKQTILQNFAFNFVERRKAEALEFTISQKRKALEMGKHRCAFEPDSEICVNPSFRRFALVVF